MATNLPTKIDALAVPGNVVDLRNNIYESQRIVVGPTHRNIAGHSSWDPVASDNTAAVNGTISAATAGDVIHVPHAIIGIAAASLPTLDKVLHFRGAGMFSSVFKPLSDTSSPIFNWAITVDSGLGIFDNYGASMEGIGLDLGSAPSATGIKLASGCPWFRGTSLFCRGGAKSIDIRQPQAKFSDIVAFDATSSFFYIVQDGLELDIRDVKVARNSAGTTSAYIAVDLTGGGGSYGALYVDNFQGNKALGTVSRPITIVATNATTFNCFLRQVVLDNCSGAGLLTKVSGVNFLDGWINTAAGSGNACWLIDSCNNLLFARNRYFGGVGGSTYEFTGGVSDGFTSLGNITATGPAYKVAATNRPTNISVDDYIGGATDEGQVTNEPAWFEGAARRSWGPRRVMGVVRRRESGTAPPEGYVVLNGSGVATVTHPLVATNTRVHTWYERPGDSTTTNVYSTVADNVAGTSFKIRGAANAGVYWEFRGDAD